MEERHFFRETPERKPFRLTCPHCSHSFEHAVLWYRRVKKTSPPPGLAAEDLLRFQNARSYMIRAEDSLICPNRECRKKVDIVGLQSVVNLQEPPSGTPGQRPRSEPLTSHASGSRGGGDPSRSRSGPEQPVLTSHQTQRGRSQGRRRRPGSGSRRGRGWLGG